MAIVEHQTWRSQPPPSCADDVRRGLPIGNLELDARRGRKPLAHALACAAGRTYPAHTRGCFDCARARGHDPWTATS
jgi:hypothetical protein